MTRPPAVQPQGPPPAGGLLVDPYEVGQRYSDGVGHADQSVQERALVPLLNPAQRRPVQVDHQRQSFLGEVRVQACSSDPVTDVAAAEGYPVGWAVCGRRHSVNACRPKINCL